MWFLEKLDSDYFIFISKFWLGVRIYCSLWHFSMVSDNESEFTDLKAEFTDSKASLNQFEPVWFWWQNFQSEFSDHFSQFQFFNMLITLKTEKWQRSVHLPNIKYNCAVLFWSQLYWIFLHDSKHIFS